MTNIINYSNTYYKLIKQQNNSLTAQQKEKILNFIHELAIPEAIKLFTEGYCLHFAKALAIAFSDLNPKIVKFYKIEQSEDLKEVFEWFKRNWQLYHATCEIGECLFDITGEVTDKLANTININQSTIISIYSNSDFYHLKFDIYTLSKDQFKKKYPLNEGTHIWLFKHYI